MNMTHHESNSSYGEIHRVDNKNTSYIFGFKQDGKWVFIPHRFILSGLNTRLYGQFISSNWFNHIFTDNNVEYMLLGITKPFKYSDIAQTINSFDTNSDNLNISQAEIGLGITLKDKFMVSKERINQVIWEEGKEGREGREERKEKENPKERSSATLKIDGEYDKSSISLSINKLANGNIYITLPDFMLKYDT
jgi:hypothetical protein